MVADLSTSPPKHDAPQHDSPHKDERPPGSPKPDGQDDPRKIIVSNDTATTPPNGRVYRADLPVDHPEHNPFDTAGADENHRRDREQTEAEQQRLKRWAPRRYAVADLPTGQRWARKLVAKIERSNSRRDLAKHKPDLTITGDKAVSAGATDEQLSELRELTDTEVADLNRREAAILRDEQRQIDALAHRIGIEREADSIEVVGRVNLADYEPQPKRWAVERILTRGGVLGLFAERKAGKTTVVESLAASALDGEKFLGRFGVMLDDTADVVLFDTEMTTDDLHRHYRDDLKVRNLDRLDLRPLRGRESRFDVRSETVRARYAATITPGSLIVVDCLYSLFGALAISENSDEVVSVLAGLRALATEASAVGLVVVHHLGKDSDRGARGHSSIEGFPDAIARIETDGSPVGDVVRTLSVFGRVEPIEPGILTLGDDRRLTLGGNPKAERIAKRHNTDDDATWSLIDRNPGLSVRGLGMLPVEQRGKLSRDRIREAVERLALVNRVKNQGSDAAPEWHALAGMDPFGEGKTD